MKNELSEEQKIMASYSTYKALFEDHKTTYDIVAAFIKASIKRNMTAGRPGLYGRINCKEFCKELRQIASND